jgi:hypothetical protein
MTTAPVHPVRSGPPQVAAGRGLTARQLADTARRVADTYPELLSTAEFDPTAVRRDEDDEVAIVRHVPVQSPRRVLLRLPALLGRPVTVVAHTTAPLVTLPGRVVGLVTLAEQTLTAVHTAVTRDDALLDRVEAVTRTAEGVVQAASRAVTAAAGTVEETHAFTARVAPLLESYSEPLHRLEPMVRRLAETTQPGEVDALVTLLERWGDVNHLLDNVSQLSHIASRLPKVFRRRNHDLS